MFQDLNNDVIADHVEAWIQNHAGVSGSTTPQAPAAPENESGKTLVVYYSATGSTEAVAGYIANATGGDTFAITPAEPYSSADLNWTDSESRVSREHDDPSLRTMELTETTVDGWEDYDTVFIGYPIWWGIAAWPVDNFINANDFTGKTVIPFCTSSSSGLGESGELLAELAGTGDWQEGQRFHSSVAEADVVEWVNGLNLQ
jgi:flavodoxin